MSTKTKFVPRSQLPPPDRTKPDGMQRLFPSQMKWKAQHEALKAWMASRGPDSVLLPYEDGICDKLSHRCLVIGPPVTADYVEACVECTLTWRRAERESGSGDAAVRELRHSGSS